MEVSVIGSSQATGGRAEFACRDQLGFCSFNGNFRVSRNRVVFYRSKSWKKAANRLTLKALRSEAITPVQNAGLRLFVGLPLDVVSYRKTINHACAISAGLKALKLLGVEGVELPVWWGIVENENMGKYDWSGYLALAEMVEKLELKLHVTLCFHACQQLNISLPKWVSLMGESDPSIYFMDRSGQQYKDCLSLAVDDLPVLGGKTPIQVYRDFCEGFKSQFSPLMGSMIKGISMGLGPEGELRYPSHHQLLSNSKSHGVGEFQCYDKNMINILKQHAEATGNPLWGLSGPHDAPTYNQSPESDSFFREIGGTWESPYGDFFLSWYSSQLLHHGDRLLSVASSTFSNTSVTAYGKLPVMHSWYRTRSHPSELAAGFYNTVNRDGYEAVAQIFAKNSCKMILPGMDLLDAQQPHGSHSSPESLLAQIRRVCIKYGVKISGQNSSVSASKPKGGFEQILNNWLRDHKAMDHFTYQRMGAYFFSPQHFPSFTEFVRSLDQPRLNFDDLPVEEKEEEDGAESPKSPGPSMSMHIA